MQIIATRRSDTDAAFYQVHSNLWGAIHKGPSIKVYQGTQLVDTFRTITDFLKMYSVHSSAVHVVRVPLLRRPHFLGDMVASVAEPIAHNVLVPLSKQPVIGRLFGWAHKFEGDGCGCPDRHAWYNWLFAFIPWKE